MAEDAIKQFAKSLHKGDVKESLILIKELRKKQSFRDKWKASAWDGWIAALERGENTALLYRMVSGIEDEELANALKDFYETRRNLVEKDPTTKGLTAGFLSEWIRLIRAYRQMNKEKQDE